MVEGVCNLHGGIQDGSVLTTAGRLTTTLDTTEGHAAGAVCNRRWWNLPERLGMYIKA